MSATWNKANPDKVRSATSRWRDRNPQWREVQMKRDRERVYGLDDPTHSRLLALQGGVCGICGETQNAKRHNLDVDHDHETGKVRGLLCRRCNLTVGRFKNIDVLIRAIQYLSHPPMDRLKTEA